MPLSEHEQRILDEIERRLAAEDPKFARQVSIRTPRGKAVRRIKLAVFAFVCGFGLLIAGFFVPAGTVPFGLAAFGVMLFSVVVGTATLKQVGRDRPAISIRPAAPKWFTRLEERWRKRFERGDGR